MMKRTPVIIILSIIFIFNIFNISLASEDSIPNAVKKFAEDRKNTRVAVLDFAGAGDKNRYGAFIADSIISELSKYRLTLLERKRLELLLKEHELSQTGVVDSEKAMKLGTLLPVDVVASGSYTEIGNKLVINGRFIHVGTGEIIYAFTAAMPVSSQDGNTAQAEKPDCEKEKSSIKKALSDLSSESLINSAVDTAVKIPFDNECGKVHYEVMYSFTRYRIYPAKYKAFLIATLNSIENPSDGSRAIEIIRYFASDGSIDSEEWKTALSALKRTHTHGLYAPFGYIFKGKGETKLLKERADEVMSLASDKKIGKPVPALQEDILFNVLSGFKINSHNESMEVPIYVFKKYSGIIPDNDKYNKKGADALEAMYFNAEKRSDRKEALAALIAFLNSRKSDALAEDCADFIKSVESKTEGRYEQDKNRIKEYTEDLITINKSLEGLYCMSVNTAKKKGYRYIVEERTLYILRNKMKCASSPSVKDLEADMQSGDWGKKLAAAETLSKMGASAAEAEATVIRYLAQQGFGYQGGRLRNFCAKTLGNINTKNPKGIELLIESFPDYDNGVSYEAEEAIKKIGLSAMPYLIKGLGHSHHAARLRCAKALGNLGRNAKPALPELKRLAAKDSDPYVQKEAKGAVQMITNDY
ncbi:MAG: HEAT repeat domain-containing protein [Spirochaetota bacterium]